MSVLKYILTTFFKCRDKGATLVDDVVIDHNEEIYRNEMIALLAEMKRDMNSYLSNLESSRARSMADLIAFNDDHYNLVSKYDLSF